MYDDDFYNLTKLNINSTKNYTNNIENQDLFIFFFLIIYLFLFC